MTSNKRSDKFSKRYKFRREISGDDTELSMTRSWITLNSDSYVQILLHLGCQTGISSFVCQTPSSISLPSPALTVDSSPISDNSNTMLPGPQQESVRFFSFYHISHSIYQKIPWALQDIAKSLLFSSPPLSLPSPNHHLLLPVFFL